MANSPKKKKQQQYTVDGVHFFESRLALQRWSAKQVPAVGLPHSTTLNPVPQIEAIATHPIASSLVEENSSAITDEVVVPSFPPSPPSPFTFGFVVLSQTLGLSPPGPEFFYP